MVIPGQTRRCLRSHALAEWDLVWFSLQIPKRIRAENFTNALSDRKMGAVVSLSGVTMLLEPIAWLVGKKIAGLILRFPIFLVPVALVFA